ncbi:MAG: nitrite/sulfite reductase [Chloroflexi bacterium]|nr:nitrite/sulfite reductase [Chloroflexota bacterium]
MTEQVKTLESFEDPELEGAPQGIVTYLPEEIDRLEAEAGRFRAGEVKEETFQAFRLKQGVYGQRQPDAQMVRVKIPGGILTDKQLVALGKLAERYAPLKKGHITTRENVQFHHVKLEDTPAALRLIGRVGLTTREACGNTVRNVITCPLAGVCKDEAFDVVPYLGAYTRHFVRHPVTQAMPRKSKAAFSPCASDCAVTPMHDLGFIARVKEENGALRKGFTILVGGGTSIMPKHAQVLYDFVPVEDYLRVCEAVLRVFNQSDELRKNKMMARIKVLIHRIGIDAFRQKVEEELKQPWAERPIDPTPLLFFDEAETAIPQHSTSRALPKVLPPEFLHWRETNVVTQRQQGYYAAHVKVPMGDLNPQQFFAVAQISRDYSNSRARITAEQNLLFRWIQEDNLYFLWEELNRLGLGEAGVHEITDITACPGTDSCKLGITNSMGLGRAIRHQLDGMNLDDPLVRGLHVKISGCPNGCGRHHVANIGFHGGSFKGDKEREVPAYEAFVGGNFEGGDVRYGQRIPVRIAAKKAPEAVKRITDFYQQKRQDGETFNAFVDRVGVKAFAEVLADFNRAVAPLGPGTIQEYMDWERTRLYEVERGEGECAV